MDQGVTVFSVSLAVVLVVFLFALFAIQSEEEAQTNFEKSQAWNENIRLAKSNLEDWNNAEEIRKNSASLPTAWQAPEIVRTCSGVIRKYRVLADGSVQTSSTPKTIVFLSTPEKESEKEDEEEAADLLFARIDSIASENSTIEDHANLTRLRLSDEEFGTDLSARFWQEASELCLNTEALDIDDLKTKMEELKSDLEHRATFYVRLNRKIANSTTNLSLYFPASDGLIREAKLSLHLPLQ